MKTSSYFAAAVIALSTLSQARIAEADETPLADAKELEKADRLFREGNAAFDAKDFTKARALYLEAYAIKKTYDIAGHLGLTEMELKLYRPAAEHLATSLRNAPPHQGKKPFEAVIRELERAKKEVATVKLEAPAGAILFVDGVEVAKAPFTHEVFLEAGSHTFEAKAPNQKGTEQRELSKGDTLTVSLKLLDLPAGPSTEPVKKPPIQPPLEEGRPMWPGWVLGGTGLALAGVGGALLGIGQSKLADAETVGGEIAALGGTCEPAVGPGSERCAEAVDTIDSGDTLSTAGVVLVGVGGAMLIGGIIYLVIPDAEPAKAALVPWATPDGAGLVVQGAF
jgi:hypothetical protein